MRGVFRLLQLCFLAFVAVAAFAQSAEETFKPIVGQEGKDVVWVPTPDVLVDKMLDFAKVTPQDFVIDLGSGDGRNVIAAAKRGARALGVEYNPKMVEFSKRAAAREGVGERAQFVEGDMYEADISQATVLALFLLPDNLNKLTPKFLNLAPGARIVANHFGIAGWTPDAMERSEGECEPWCTVLLYVVPAKVAGTWRMPDGELKLEQEFQMVSGTLTSGGTARAVSKGRLNGNEIMLDIEGAQYVGRVNGESIVGTSPSAWRAVRVGP